MSNPDPGILGVLAALAFVLATCLFLFVSLKRDLQSMKGDLRKSLRLRDNAHQELESRLAELAGQSELARLSIDEFKRQVDLFASTHRERVLHSGIDANQRTQVLRLAKRGEQAARIATDLRLPKNEVDLLVKVHHALAGSR